MNNRETTPSAINGANAARDSAIALHMQGRLSDAEPLYEQSLRRAAQDFQTLFMYGVLTLQIGQLERAAKLFRRAIAIDPNDAAAHCNLGTVRAQQGLCEQAVASFQRAIALEPRYAEAHGNLGVMLFNLNRFEQALASYDHALHLQPDAATLHSNRGNVLQKLQRYAEALASFDTSIELAPEHAELHNNRGQCLIHMGRHEEAICSFDSSIRLGPHSPEAHYSKGLALLTLGDFDGGWPLHEWRSNSGRMMPTRAPEMPCPRWRGENDIRGKTLFIHWEQGFGDTIQFCRFAKLAQESGVHVLLEVQPQLAPLLRCLGPSIEIVRNLDRVKQADYHCPMMSLPKAFGTDLATIPYPGRYLNSEHGKVQQWRSEVRPSSAPLVGLAWRGNPSNSNDLERSLDLARLVRHLPQGPQYVSLQLDPSKSERVLLASAKIRTLLKSSSDFSDTAGLVDCLDVVITVDTSVAHLSGALGRATWLLLPYSSDWRWLRGRIDSPWYKSIRLFRQKLLGCWEDPLARIEAALAALRPGNA